MEKKIKKIGNGYWMPIKYGWIYLGEKRRAAKKYMKYLKRLKRAEEVGQMEAE